MNRTVLVIAALVALVPLAGCSVRVHDDDVKVAVGGELINVDVNDESGVDVKVPGVSVSAGNRNGVNVNVPGVHVSVPAGSERIAPVTVTAGENGGAAADPGAVPVDLAVPAEAKRVDLRLSLPMGGLTVVRGGSHTVTGQIGYVRTTPVITTSLSGSRWTVDIPRESQSVRNNGAKVPDSVLQIGTDLPTSLDLTVNMGSADLDLQEINLERLKVTVLMGEMTLQLPPDANIRLTLKQAMGTNNLAAAGFVRQGDSWVSPGFRNENVVDVDLQLNMGSLTVAR